MSTSSKMDPRYLEIYNANVVENEEHILRICAIVNKKLAENFDMVFCNPKTKAEDLKLIPAVFVVMFDSIMESIKGLTKQYSEFYFDVAGRFKIGFSTKETDHDELENEKVGNITVGIIHSDKGHKNEEFDRDLDALERCVQWNSDNVKENITFIKNLTIKMKENIKNRIGLHIQSEMIMPLFCTIYDTTFDYFKEYMRLNNIDELDISFMSCFRIIAQYTDDGKFLFGVDPIYIGKQSAKDDLGATSTYE